MKIKPKFADADRTEQKASVNESTASKKTERKPKTVVAETEHRKVQGKRQKFWDDFESSINQDDELANVEKFKYLKSCLEGDALKVIGGYERTAANYQAVDALKERFGEFGKAICSCSTATKSSVCHRGILLLTERK